jgi:hypothetical protein
MMGDEKMGAAILLNRDAFAWVLTQWPTAKRSSSWTEVRLVSWGQDHECSGDLVASAYSRDASRHYTSTATL